MTETLIEHRTHLTAPFGKPDRSASPVDDREPDREHRPCEPEKRIDPPYSAEALRAESIEGARRVNFIEPSLNIAMDVCSPEYRPPVHKAPREGRRDLAIVINGEVRYQQDQPIHTSGAVYGSEREQRRRIRGVSEAHAQREAVAAQLAHIAALISKDNAAKIAGGTPARLARRRGGAK